MAPAGTAPSRASQPPPARLSPAQPSAAPAPRTPAGGSPLCVGRESELATLLASYDRASADGSLLTLVHGAAGAGKSRVLGELGRRLRLEGCPVLEGRAEPGRPFGAFASIVERALRFLTEVGKSCEVDLSDLACREGCHAFWYQHEDDALKLEARSESGRFGPAKVMERRMRFFDAVAALLREVARVRTPLIVLHDLDRADGGTSTLLAHLLDGSSWLERGGHGAAPRTSETGALFVASCRSIIADDGSALAELLGHPSGGTLELGPLDADGVRAYLQSPEAIAQVLERTEGVPERLDLLLQARPLTPEESLRLRFQTLPTAARALLETLAVLGHSGDLDTLAGVACHKPDAASVAALRASPLIQTEVLDGRILLSFARESARERAYAMLDDATRRGLHARFAEHFAGTLDSSTPNAGQRAHSEQAARHALLAGDVDRALPLVTLAARSLAARHAHSEAAALLEELPTEWLTSTDQNLLAELAELHRMAGNYPRALEHAKALQEREAQSSAAARRVGDLLTQAGHLAEATRMLEEARSLAAKAEDVCEGAQAEALLAELHYQRAKYDEAVQCAEAALQGAGEDLPLAMHARNTLGKVALARREASAAAELFEQNRALARRHALGHAEAQALTNLGVALLRRQDFDGARDTFEDAIEVAGRAGDTRDHAIATENLAVLAHLRRDAAAALVHYHEAIAQLKRLGNRGMLARVANNLGELYLSLGDRTRARSLCNFATHVGGLDLSPAVTAEGLLLRGRIDLADHELSQARGSFEAALTTFETIGEERRIDAALALVRVCLAEGRVAEAETAVAGLADDALTPKRRAELALIRAELDRAAGRPALSAAHRACTLAEAAQDSQRLLPGLLHRCRAHLDEGDIAAAARDLDRAYEVDAELTSRIPPEVLETWARRPLRGILADLDGRLEGCSSQAGARATHPSRRPSQPPAQAETGAELRRLRQLFPNMVGSSAPMAQVLGMLSKVAPTDTIVLIRGESGTGKELVAEALHQHSTRRARPMVKVNCAALVETLLLSELFGHERGAFTGATSRKKGRFELADGGTIFLDEIGDISPKTQVALLRVLQERRFERVGGTQSVEVDVRIVAATHRDLEAMVREGSFREDLYYRLRGVMLEMPPLRRRLDDLAELSGHLLERIASERGDAPKRLSPESVALLSSHSWPGNVRELENVLRSATLFSDAPTLDPIHLEAFASSFTGLDQAVSEAGAPLPQAEPAALEDLLYTRVRGGDLSLLEMKKTLERDCIARAIAETEGNITRAAGLLGMKRPRLSQLVKQYGLLESSSKRTS